MSDEYRRIGSSILEWIANDYKQLDVPVVVDHQLVERLIESSRHVIGNPNITEIAGYLRLLIDQLRSFGVGKSPTTTAELEFLNEYYADCFWPRKVAVVYFLAWFLCQCLLNLTDKDDRETKTTLQVIIHSCFTAIEDFDGDYQKFKRDVGRLKIIGPRPEIDLTFFNELCLDLNISGACLMACSSRTPSEFPFYELSGAFSSLFSNRKCFRSETQIYTIPRAYNAPTTYNFYTHTSNSRWTLAYKNLNVELSHMTDKQGFNHNLLISKSVTQGIVSLFFPDGVGLNEITSRFEYHKSCFEHVALNPIEVAERDVENVLINMLEKASWVANLLTAQLGITCRKVRNNEAFTSETSYGDHTIIPDWHLVTELSTKEKVQVEVFAAGETKQPVSGHAVGTLNLGGVLDESDKEEIRRIARKAESMGLPSCDVNRNVDKATGFADETWVQVVAGLSAILDVSSKSVANGNYIETNGEVYLITWDGSCLIIAKVPGKDGFGLREEPSQRHLTHKIKTGPFKQLKPEAVWVAMVEEQDIFANVVFFLVNHNFRLLRHKVHNGTVLEASAHDKFNLLLDHMERSSSMSREGGPNNNNNDQSCSVLETPFNNGGEELLKDATNRNNTFKEALELTLSEEHQSFLKRGENLTFVDFVVKECIANRMVNRFTVLLVVRKVQPRKSVLKIFLPTQSEAFFNEVTAYISLDDSFPKGSVHRRNFAECYGFGSINWQGLEVYYIELEYISGSHIIWPDAEEMELVDSAVKSLQASKIVHHDLHLEHGDYRNVIIDKAGKRAVIIDFEMSARRTEIS